MVSDQRRPGCGVLGRCAYETWREVLMGASPFDCGCRCGGCCCEMLCPTAASTCAAARAAAVQHNPPLTSRGTPPQLAAGRMCCLMDQPTHCLCVAPSPFLPCRVCAASCCLCCPCFGAFPTWPYWTLIYISIISHSGHVGV